jgi:hypothetical protein
VKFLVDMPLSPELVAWLRSQQHDARHAIERMADLLGALAPAEIERSIIVVERHRIRRRRLPIVQSDPDE